MNWNDYYLWAALVLLIEVFYHFIKQRTLWDKNSRVFIEIVILGILHCLLGIGMTRLQMLQIEVKNEVILALAAGHYLVNTAIPFEMLRFTLTMCDDYERQERRITRVGLVMWLTGAILILASIRTGFVSLAENVLPRSGMFFDMYSAFLMIYFTFNLCFLMRIRKLLGKEEIKAFLEANAIVGLGLFSQQYLHIQLFFGFAMAIAILVIYILVKNPHAYMDEETLVFNEHYFRIWMRDRKNHWKGSLLVIDFYNLESINFIYSGDQKLIVKIAGQLNELKGNLPMFRVAPGRFVLCSQGGKELDNLTQKLERWLERGGVYSGKNYVKCRALVTEVQLLRIEDIKELKAYTDFLVNYALTREYSKTLYDSAELKKRFDYEMEIEHFLNTAVEQDLFQVWYQPIYSMERKGYVSLEGLSRLKHPALGWISPELFIKIAVKNGWSTKITQLQLEKVCRFIKDNESALQGIHNIKINLSPCELLETGYCEKLLAIIRENAIPFSRIQFEITETTATQYTKETFDFIKTLQMAGVGLCLDDFGSGYANLNTVLRLPYSTVKIDRSLLQGICDSPQKADFYKDLFGIIKKQGFSVVAEGVETEPEAKLLSGWNIDLFQGYYFSKPLPEEELIPLLRKEN